jgi:competence protein ComEC
VSVVAESLPTRPRRWQLPRVAALSPLGALLLLGGIAFAMLQRELPAAWLLGLALGVGVLVTWRLPRARWAAMPLAGFAWASLHGLVAMEQRLPEALQGADLVVTGHVVGLPQPGERRVGFGFRVAEGEGAGEVLAGRELRLAWYGSPPALEPGSQWTLTVRLKRPRGVLNPGGFDYERHALQRRIAATGHVRESASWTRHGDAAGIDALRLQLSDAIATRVERPSHRFLQGLAVGDTRALESRDWDILRATGLSHLLAISGLHIGLVAGFGALLARALYWLWPGIGLRLPRPQGMALVALVAAAGYAALAGFGLPTQRSLAMITAVLLAVLLRRNLSAAQSLALAGIVILLADPLAVLGAGFWLSFLGVMWLLLCLPATSGPLAAAVSLLRAQWAMSLGLLPLTLWFFGQASMAGALANLVAVPWVTLGVVPPTLIGTALLAVAPTLAHWPLALAAWSMEWLWRFATWLSNAPWAQLHVAEVSLVGVLLALCGVGWLLLPRGIPGKPLAALLLLPVLFPLRAAPEEGALELVVLDVGQGLSVLVRSAGQNVLYDAGPAFEGGLDMGEAAVVPALRALGVRRLDTLVLSHSDMDHAGGAAAVRRAWPDARVLSGEPTREPGAEACISGQGWRHGAIAVEVLHPPEHFPELRNDSSCVLRIEAPGGALLLTGDIGSVIEARLLREAGERLKSRLLVVPHHGSHSSSSAPFVAAVAADIALIGVGHRNRFGHPREDVLARYRAQGSQLLDTAAGGAVHVRLDPTGGLHVQRRRESHRRFWHEP